MAPIQARRALEAEDAKGGRNAVQPVSQKPAALHNEGTQTVAADALLTLELARDATALGRSSLR